MQTDDPRGIPDPTLYGRFCNALNRHQGVVLLPPWLSGSVEPVTALAIIIGASCSRTDIDTALNYVAGYSVSADFTTGESDPRPNRSNVSRCWDGLAPIGPWLVPRDMVSDPNNPRLSTSINGALRHMGSTSYLSLTCEELISFCPHIMTLNPIAGTLLDRLGPRTIVLADKAYDAHRIRELIQNQGATPNIPPKATESGSRASASGSTASAT